MSFRSRTWRKGTAWAEEETDLFFRILSATGPDFSLMHDFFPTRTRSELKNKFNREQRANGKRLNDALKMPSTLDESLYEIAREVTEFVEEKRTQDKASKAKAKKTTESEVPDVDWDEQNVDLQAEAEREIARLETAIEQEPSRYGRKRKMRQDMDAENVKKKANAGLVSKVLESVEQKVRKLNEQKQLNDLQAARDADSKRFPQYRQLGLPLGSNFPPFEIAPTSAHYVSIVPNPIEGQPPIVHLPRNSEYRVIPPTDGATGRVLFICPALNADGPALQYVLQHERSTDPDKHDFLHLFGNPPPSSPLPAVVPSDQTSTSHVEQSHDHGGGGGKVVDNQALNIGQ